MTKTEKRDSNFKLFVKSTCYLAIEEGATDVTRVDICNVHFGWRNRYNINHVKGTPGFHVSRLMEEVANEEGWVFAYDVRANGARDNIRIEFPQNAANRTLKVA
jgi:CRISPR/Cas system CMR-associated protein Cmr3 (group 5 of RAMP superfamily)